MNKTAKPRIGGIMSIISGALGLLGIISYSIGIGDAGSGFVQGDMPPFVPSIIFVMSIPAIIIARFRVTALEPTTVPIEFATSLAPILQAE